MKILIKICLLTIGLLFIGCSSHKYVAINAVKAAKFENALKYKKIAVLEFKNDRTGLSNNLEQQLQDKKFKNRNLFQMVSRKEMKDILNEQNLNMSGLVKKGEQINLGNIEGVDALIFGSVNNASVRDDYFFKIRSYCADKKCKEIVRAKINCTRREYSTSVSFKMVDVETSKIVISKTYVKKTGRSLCEDEYNSFETTAVVIDRLQLGMVDRFVNTITPTEYKVIATIAEEEPEYELTDKEEDLIEKGNIAFERDFIEKAEKNYKEVLSLSKGKSYVATYNLALINEEKGNIEKAEALYDKCVEMIKDLSKVPELQESIYRMKKNKKEKKLAENQINI